MPDGIPRSISKELSRNDAGETGAHQAGILIPQEPAVRSFFPELDEASLNPRIHLDFIDSTGQHWLWAYIYYNNRKFGGTRNEYRLTRMTPFINRHNLRAGDTLILERGENGRYLARYSRAALAAQAGSRLSLGSSWKIVSI